VKVEIVSPAQCKKGRGIAATALFEEISIRIDQPS